MILFGEGLLTGLMLTLMLGPVTMVILRYGLQVNRMAGIWAAAGTWVSDFIFITLTYWMTTAIDTWTRQPDSRLTIYLAGGLGLLVMGLLMLRVRKQPRDEATEPKGTGYIQAFMAGFLVNSMSPFTLFFWLGAALFVRLQPEQPMWYYAGVMSSLALGDFTKAWIAPKLTSWLRHNHVYWIQIISGILIACTGLYVLILGFIERYT